MIRHAAHRPRRHARSLAGVLVGLALAPAALAECSEVHGDRVPNPHGNQIRLIPEAAGAPLELVALDSAVSMWTGTCAGAVPAFAPDGNIVVRMRFHDGANDIPGCGDGCACTISNTLPAVNGEYLTSAITHLFERHRDGRGYCRAHREETLAHELGHVLGFRHPDDPYDAKCWGKIMSFSRNRSVQPAACQALSALWRHPLAGAPDHRQPPAVRAMGVAEAEGALEEPRQR